MALEKGHQSAPTLKAGACFPIVVFNLWAQCREVLRGVVINGGFWRQASEFVCSGGAGFEGIWEEEFGVGFE
ncbi:hypothetical protein RchiOBHm_Chr2g0115691 [Rosa chinensis]|uniref:Uncharacterized protein n=1 Tax=Rosa chinensis TaxID=74649 RepID=A0A2P6RR27_ROSCH|nr:hypothetical protein RchiOBHm_Chr2g0115691 [Rosa chinensis]